MKRWEYFRDTWNGTIVLQELNVMGQRGWELMYYSSVQHNTSLGPIEYVTVVMKRELL